MNLMTKISKKNFLIHCWLLFKKCVQKIDFSDFSKQIQKLNVKITRLHREEIMLNFAQGVETILKWNEIKHSNICKLYIIAYLSNM